MNLDEAKTLILDINKIVAKLDQSVRARAFELLTDIAFDDEIESADNGERKKKKLKGAPNGTTSKILMT